MSALAVRTPTLPPPDPREVSRYARTVPEDTAVSALLREVIGEAEGCIAPRAVLLEAPLSIEGNTLQAAGMSVTSPSLARLLAGCSRVLLVAATLGPGIDRLIGRYARLSPARALVLEALGTERIEATLNTLERELSAAYGRPLAPRRSPGYGDLPLSLQRDFFALLSPERHIGLFLTDSLLMVPQKSVTAFIGIMDA